MCAGHPLPLPSVCVTSRWMHSRLVKPQLTYKQNISAVFMAEAFAKKRDALESAGCVVVYRSALLMMTLEVVPGASGPFADYHNDMTADCDLKKRTRFR